jgi:plastocyanin
MKGSGRDMNYVSRLIAGIFLSGLWVGMANAGVPVYQIEIREHLFYPAELTIPAGQKVKLVVLNRDPTPEEFESFELNREKVILGKRKAVIFIGPLRPGRYPYFGEFHPETAQGMIIAE